MSYNRELSQDAISFDSEVRKKKLAPKDFDLELLKPWTTDPEPKLKRQRTYYNEMPTFQ